MNRRALALLALSSWAAPLWSQSDILPGSSSPPPCSPESTSTILLRTVARSSTNPNLSAGVTIRLHSSLSPAPSAVDFAANYNFGGPVVITGLQIRSGAAGQPGPIVLDSGISATAPVQSQSGSGSINLQIAGPTGGPLAAAMRQISANPGQYYVEFDTADAPSGALRGQLAIAQQAVAMALLSPFNETPVLPGNATAAGTLIANITRTASGTISSAELTFDLNYQFPSLATMTALQVQQGAARTNGPSIIHLELGNIVVAIGSGNVRQVVEADVTQPAVAAFVESLLVDPSNYYLNLLTNANPSGGLRSQLARASRSTLQTTMCTGVADNNPAGAAVTIDVLRSTTGALVAGMVTYDIDYQVAPNTQIVSAGISGAPTTVSAAQPLVSASGMGNLYQLVTVFSAQGLQQLEYILAGRQQALAMVTAAQVRTLGAIPLFTVTGNLRIDTIQSGSGDASAPAAAPGGLIALFGNFPAGLPDFSPVDVTGLFNQPWPTSLNSTWVTIGDRNIPTGYHSLTQVDALIPTDLAPGPYQVRYWVSRNLPSFTATLENQPDYRSDPFILTVAPQAPGIFVSASGPVVTHAATGLPVTAAQPATAGETLYVYATGIAGQPGVSASIGNSNATATPVAIPFLLPGVQIFALTVPAGVSGSQTLTLTAAGTYSSNSVTLAFR